MRKMTKTVATLAAMSAMTVASASLAFAAEKQVEGLTGGDWQAQANGGWKYKTEAGVQLKDTWAEIDGVWYYFKGDVMAQDRFLVLDDKGYFFDGNGRLATGWQKISSKMDAYGDLSISEDLYYPTNNGYEAVNDEYEYDYHDFVWCYFDENGVAKENEWFNDPSSGRWYYFDENVMVKNVFNYVVQPDNYDVTQSSTTKYYGFDANGAMMTGWNSKKTKTTWNNPTADDKGDVWYYYKSNGQMQKAGWAEIDGEWYLFAEMDDENKAGDNGGKWLYGGFPLIVNSYVASYKNGSSPEYFFVDGDGKLQNDVQNVKKAWKVLFYNNDNDISVAYEQEKVKDEDIYVNFSDKGFAAKKGVKDNNYYALSNSNVFKATFGTTTGEVKEINNKLYDATDIFTNYSTLVKTNWNFTDAGVATTSSVDTTATKVADAYVHKDNFTTVPKTTYDAWKKSEINAYKCNDYFAMVDTQDAEDARVLAAAAYVTAYGANGNGGTNDALKDAQEDWDDVLETVYKSTTSIPTPITGYNPDVITGTDMAGTNLLNELIACTTLQLLQDKRDARIDRAVFLKSVYDAALSRDASDTVVTNAKKEWTEAANIATEYKELCELYEGHMMALAMTQNEPKYNALLAAERAHAVAEAEYNAAAADAYYYDYADFENQWDQMKETDVTDFAVVGERVKNAFIAQDDDKLYMVDGDGKLVANKAVLIDDDANIVHKNYLTGVGTMTYDNAYLVFGSDGLATIGYTDTKKTISIGGVSYWSTGETVTIGKATATIFVGDKKLNGKY